VLGRDRRRSRYSGPILLTFANGRAAQKIKFSGELSAGSIADDIGNPFIDFFRSTRNRSRKGIIAIDLERLQP
jgi:hypothetical protein